MLLVPTLMYHCQKKGWLFYVNALANSIKCAVLFLSAHEAFLVLAIESLKAVFAQGHISTKDSGDGYLGCCPTPFHKHTHNLSTDKIVHLCPGQS